MGAWAGAQTDMEYCAFDKQKGERMEQYLTTAHYSPSEQFSFWREVICEAFVEMSPSYDGGGAFRGELYRSDLQGVGITQVKAQSHSATRQLGELARSDADFVLLHLQKSGLAQVSQRKEQALLAPGDIACFDATEPFALNLYEDFESVTAKIPRYLLQERDLDAPVREIFSISRCNPVAPLLAGYLTMATVPNETNETGDLLAQKLLANHICEALGVAVQQAGSGCRKHANLPDQMRFDQITRYMALHACDANLTARKVAGNFHISLRGLQQIFQRNETTFSRWLLQCRLAKCCQLLTDPASLHRPITSIAYHCGFNDLSYFGRSFKQAYDMTPSEYRNQELSRSISLGNSSTV